jgi:hypothetical protein
MLPPRLGASARDTLSHRWQPNDDAVIQDNTEANVLFHNGSPFGPSIPQVFPGARLQNFGLKARLLLGSMLMCFSLKMGPIVAKTIRQKEHL